jgi:DedD protein
LAVAPPPESQAPAAEKPVTPVPAGEKAEDSPPAVTSKTPAVADNPPVDKSTAVPPRTGPAWVVQLASLENRANADKLVRDLQRAGYPAYLEELKSGTGVLFRVRVGPELQRSDAEVTLKNLSTKMKLEGIIQSYP